MVLVPQAARKYQIICRCEEERSDDEAISSTHIEMQPEQKLIWRSPEEIVEIAFQRAPVVMMNEAHSGLKRCIRTRQIGKRILPVAHQAGVRHLAMEALFPQFAEHANHSRTLMRGDFGYLSQPEMKDFIQTVLDLGWTLIPYEADNFKWISEKHDIDFTKADAREKYHRLKEFQSEFTGMEFTNWREEQQALNFIKALAALAANTPILVWCGNNHHAKEGGDGWLPMGYQFRRHSGIDPFVIDQDITVKFHPSDNFFETELIEPFAEELTKFGGTAGLLVEEIPSTFDRFDLRTRSEDALLISTQNKLE